jgi:hypothetical protein
MNYANYRAVKQAGTVRIEKYGADFMAVKRKFDPNTGAEVAPEMTGFTREDIAKHLEIHKTAIEELTALLSDLDAIK